MIDVANLKSNSRMNYDYLICMSLVRPKEYYALILGCQSNWGHKETSPSNLSVNVDDNGELVNLPDLEKNNCYLPIFARLRNQKERHGGDVNNFLIGDRSR